MGNQLNVSSSGKRVREGIKKYTSLILTTLLALVFVWSCVDDTEEDVKPQKDEPKLPKITAPAFNEDSAYAFIDKQVSFGPRVPNSIGHMNCGKYLEEKLKSYGYQMVIQNGKVKGYNGDEYNIKNIMGRLNPEKKKRILLLAHWDTRFMADRDTANVGNAIDGANDGGSGVGVLLEMARLIKEKPPHWGIDILFVDAEDQGESGGMIPDTWCLGIQYWAKNPPIAKYRAQYGILLDMVGGNKAKFQVDETTQIYASQLARKIWKTGNSLGYGDYFINKKGGQIVDDHKYVNTLMGIPCADIVDYSTDRGFYGDFHPSHHRNSDNMSIIDKMTLKAVGQTVLEVVYSEQ